jgi:hypothetical protein
LVAEPGVDTQHTAGFFPTASRARAALLLGLFAAAFAIRLLHINDIEFAPLRQHRSAIMARAYYYETRPDLPAWQRDVAAEQLRIMGLLEPPILEHATAILYRAAGGEYLWIPRVLTSGLWLLGGWFVFLLVRRLHSADTAFIALAFFLLLPFGVVAGRAFQPHGFETMLIAASALCIWRYFERPSAGRLLAAAGVAAVAGLVYAPGLILISAVFLAMAGPRKWLSPATIVFFLVSFSLALAYYGYGVVANNGVRGQLLSSVKLHLLLTPGFWAGWLAQIHNVVGLPAAVAALAGLALYRAEARKLLLGLAAGYVIYSLLLSYHTSTHDYYQLINVPLVAMAMAPFLGRVLGLATSGLSRPVRCAIVAACCVLGVAAAGVRIIEYNFDRHGRWQKNERAIAPKIGDIVGHSTRLVYLSISGGFPLFYYGQVAGAEVMVRNALLETYLERRTGVESQAELVNPDNLGFVPEFFVVTELLEFKRRPELGAFLDANYPLIANELDFRIYDLRRKR